MKILVAGCSFATELSNIIQNKIPGCSVTDVASAAAGNKFIADSVILTTLKQKFDVIYVSWSGLSRYDVVVADPKYFDNWTSKANLDNKHYIFTGSIGSWDHHNHPFANMLFGGYHRFAEQKELQYNSLLEMIKLKGYLESTGIPFYFTTMINQFNIDLSEPVLARTSEISAANFPEHKFLINELLVDNWILKDGLGIFETMYNLNLISDDGFHPTIAGYEIWMDLFVDRLKEDKIL